MSAYQACLLLPLECCLNLLSQDEYHALLSLDVVFGILIFLQSLGRVLCMYLRCGISRRIGEDKSLCAHFNGLCILN